MVARDGSMVVLVSLYSVLRKFFKIYAMILVSCCALLFSEQFCVGKCPFQTSYGCCSVQYLLALIPTHLNNKEGIL